MKRQHDLDILDYSIRSKITLLTSFNRSPVAPVFACLSLPARSTRFRRPTLNYKFFSGLISPSGSHQHFAFSSTHVDYAKHKPSRKNVMLPYPRVICHTPIPPYRIWFCPSAPISLHSMVMMKMAWDRELRSFIFVKLKDFVQMELLFWSSNPYESAMVILFVLFPSASWSHQQPCTLEMLWNRWNQKHAFFSMGSYWTILKELISRESKPPALPKRLCSRWNTDQHGVFSLLFV